MKLLIAFWNWLVKPRTLYADGFDYAMDELSKGTPVEELEAKCHNPFDFNDFDRGMIRAIYVWERLNHEPKD